MQLVSQLKYWSWSQVHAKEASLQRDTDNFDWILNPFVVAKLMH